jgi:ketosteroid isomerase-like protein
MAFIGMIEDRLDIRDLYGLYADASCRADREEWVACFADDCQWNSHVFQQSGKHALRAQWDSLWVNFSSLAFLSEVHAIEVDGDTAVGRALAREIVRLKNGGLYKLVGLYDDRLVRVGGRWFFSVRNYRPLVEELPA